MRVENQPGTAVVAQVEVVINDAAIPVVACGCAGDVALARQHKGNRATGLQGEGDCGGSQRSVGGVEVRQGKLGSWLLAAVEHHALETGTQQSAVDAIAEGGSPHGGTEQCRLPGACRASAAGSHNMGAPARVAGQCGAALGTQQRGQYLRTGGADFIGRRPGAVSLLQIGLLKALQRRYRVWLRQAGVAPGADG